MHNSFGSMHRVRKIHFIGICGAGMSGIAEVLNNIGYSITGSDIADSDSFHRLKSQGIEVKLQHKAESIEGADVVVYSSAIPSDNVELIEARNRRIPIVPRAEMLAELMRFRNGIAVAGTHGKTTTTSLIAAILADANLDPTFVVGGLVRSTNSNARLGNGEYLVAEADESDGSFLLLQPVVSVITNIDADHLSAYANNFHTLQQSFLEFARRLPFYGVACVCIDDKAIAEIEPEIRARVITYGFGSQADVRGVYLKPTEKGEHFRVTAKEDRLEREFTLNLFGRHNVQNALAAIAVGLELGVNFETIDRALRNFQGIDRRFQVTDKVIINNKVLTVIDDYGHHPTELSAVFETVRKHWKGRRICAVFQPHRYSRTKELFDDFVTVLSRTDTLVLLEVYSAGEAIVPSADSKALAHAVSARRQVAPILVEHLGQAREMIEEIVEDNDVLVFLGAGSISSLARDFVS
jgi:UDP-N-acetylmuramate--alanine ligase